MYVDLCLAFSQTEKGADANDVHAIAVWKAAWVLAYYWFIERITVEDCLFIIYS